MSVPIPSRLGWLLCVLVCAASCGLSQELRPRPPLGKRPVRIPEGATEYRVIVKFVDSVKARATPNGGLVSEAKPPADLSAVEDVASQFGLSFSQLIDLPDAKLEDLESRAAAGSRVTSPTCAG